MSATESQHCSLREKNRGNGEETLLEKKMNGYFLEMMNERNPRIKKAQCKQVVKNLKRNLCLILEYN